MKVAPGVQTEPLEVRVPIRDESDVAIARTQVRAVAVRLGLAEVAREALVTAVSEVARNVVAHAETGEIRLRIVEQSGRRALVVVARDVGPGIADVDAAMEDGYSTAGGLGLGLSGARRLTDDFEIASSVGRGTTVSMRKWIA